MPLKMILPTFLAEHSLDSLLQFPNQAKKIVHLIVWVGKVIIESIAFFKKSLALQFLGAG